MQSVKMKMITFLFSLITICAFAKETPARLNFIVSTNQTHFDQAPFSFQIQAKVMRMFHKKEMFVIITPSTKNMADRIISILEKKHAMIGNIWFDSHGHWQRRRSLFEVGKEEFSYLTICDSLLTANLQRLAPYCDTNSNVGIGSCYGGATFTLPAIETFPEARMNGDSLMIGMSRIFNHATVYASESFVMTKPFIMSAAYALSGCPGRKKFKDPIYSPVWQRIGTWNCYSGKTGTFLTPATVTLYHDGRIGFKKRTFISFMNNQHKLAKIMQKLKRGNYNIATLYHPA